MVERVPARYRPGELLPVLRSLSENEQALDASVRALRARNPAWPEGVDARLTVFAKCQNVTQATLLALTCLHHHVAYPAWWTERLGLDLSKRADDHQIYLLNYSQFAKIAYLHQSFSAVESAFRILLRAIDAEACDRGTAEFKSIYDALLSRVLPGDTDSPALLDLLRLTRNTVHNGGVFFHRRLQRAEVVCRGQRYDFRQGERVLFATWPFVVSLMRDLGQLLERVIAAPTVGNIPPPVVDGAYI